MIQTRKSSRSWIRLVIVGCCAMVVLPGILIGCGGGATSMPPSEEENAKYMEMVNRSKERSHDQDGERILYAAINQFYQDTGRMPSNLTEIVAFNILDTIPAAPDGLEYYYAAEKGRIITVRKSAARAEPAKKPNKRPEALNAIP